MGGKGGPRSGGAAGEEGRRGGMRAAGESWSAERLREGHRGVVQSRVKWGGMLLFAVLTLTRHTDVPPLPLCVNVCAVRQIGHSRDPGVCE